MSDYQQRYALWDEFLEAWPADRLTTMTLNEYSQAGSKETFIYWLEARLDKLGSIWGGSSFKFGVFSRSPDDNREKKNDKKLSYSATHGWYTSLGATAEEAFEKVKGYVARVAEMAAKGDVDGIEAFKHLGEAFKWKIAFHYQNRENPVIVPVFKKEWIAAWLSETTKHSMGELQKDAAAKRGAEVGILEFGASIWEDWSKNNLKIWKLSHGNPPVFTEIERQRYLADAWVLMNRHTNAPGPGEKNKGKQGKDFAEAPEGTLFYLCHGNSPQLIGQFTSEALPSDKGDGWLQRRYRVIRRASNTAPYTANSKKWSPKGNSTFWLVGAHDLPEFESTLLEPYFGIKLAELAPKPVPSAFNRIYYGPPGTGKTYKLIRLIKQDYGKRFRFVTFHQSYGYEEFVEGLRPVLGEDSGDGGVKYEIRPGVFKTLCEEARQAPAQRFAMVIDEINRGNISKIFGELITLIETDKRDPLDGNSPPVRVTLAYSGKEFSVPANVDIIGAMNTADRSLALLDTALRRRFDFEELMPNLHSEKDPNDPDSAPLAGLVVTCRPGATIDIRQMLAAINKRIEALYDRDHCIGHTYFLHLLKVDDGEDRFKALTTTFRKRIMPLLQEYFFEDWQKIRLVLADNQKPEDAQFIAEEENSPAVLFGNEHGLDEYSIKRRYFGQDKAFDNPDAYIDIYPKTLFDGPREE